MSKLKPHPLAELLPPMTDAEFASLKADIEQSGLREPIVLLEGKILDGRHRYRACVELGREPMLTDYKKAWGDPTDFVISKANHRNMSESQKACVAALMMEKLEAEAAQRRKAGGKDLREKSPEGQTGRAREIAGRLFGVNDRYVSDARLLLSNNRKAYDKVFAGETPIAVAVREYRRQIKARSLKAQVKRLGELPPEARPEDCKIDCRDGAKFLQSLPDACARLIFVDPKYNIGIDYGSGADADRLSHAKYLQWATNWIDEAHRVLKPDGAIFIMVSAELLADFEMILRGNAGIEGFHRRNVIVWHETFGNYESGNFSPCWRPILYYTKHATKHVWHGDQILIESDRQKKYGDKRANPAGKVPSNVWDFPRVVDNAKERVPGFPTQIPQALVERIVLVASDPGDLVVDVAVGSGTTAAAALKHHRRFAGCDLEAANVQAATARAHRAISERSKPFKENV